MAFNLSSNDYAFLIACVFWLYVFFGVAVVFEVFFFRSNINDMKGR